MRKRWLFKFMFLSARAAGGEARRGGSCVALGPSVGGKNSEHRVSEIIGVLKSDA